MCVCVCICTHACVCICTTKKLTTDSPYDLFEQQWVVGILPKWNQKPWSTHLCHLVANGPFDFRHFKNTLCFQMKAKSRLENTIQDANENKYQKINNTTTTQIHAHSWTEARMDPGGGWRKNHINFLLSRSWKCAAALTSIHYLMNTVSGTTFQPCLVQRLTITVVHVPISTCFQM